MGEPAGLTTAGLPDEVQVVVAGGGPVGLACAVERAARARDVPLRVFGLPGPDGPALTLVRPDQYVAWAGDRAPADPWP